MGPGQMKYYIVRTIQAFQLICLRIIAKAPLYVTHKLLHDNLLIKIINEKNM